MEKVFHVYILASRRNGTLYIGMTSNLLQRIQQHKDGVVEGFTKDHEVTNLVWYEQHENAESAIKRERSMKEWKRDWKINALEEMNPDWADLFPRLIRRANL